MINKLSNIFNILLLLLLFIFLGLFDFGITDYKENFEAQDSIPKVIYQTVKDKTNIPYKITECMNTLKKMNPEYSHKIYDNKDIIEYLKKKNDPEILSIYESINDEYGPAKADLFRYILMYDKGGVYLDAKSGCSKPLRDLIKKDDEFLLYYWDKENTSKRIGNKNGEIPQWYIITKPKHPFLKDVIKNVCQNIRNYDFNKDGYGKSMVLKITGPDIFTNTIEKKIENDKNLKYRFVPIFDYLRYNNIDFGKKEYDIMNHQNVFKNHYSNLTIPLIKTKKIN